MASESNKKIAKNTMYLYVRMLLVMAVTLYTSRVVLHQLGVDDYGIYSVLGGVITLFAFFNQSVSASTQRFITYELGRPEGNVSAIFSACLRIHVWMCVVILVIAETIGLWFVNCKMNFPFGSMAAVNWTYQLSVVGCLATVLRSPYNALVLAHEKMSFYAFNSIIDVTLKLIIVFLLIVIPDGKLVWYVFMLTCVTVSITVWYAIYCRKNFTSVKIVRVSDKGAYREILSFSGWASVGGLANMGYQQGVNVIINLFYGVALNAAVGIATQVSSAVSQFAHGFQQALNPQLTKSEASGNKSRQNDLIILSAKYSYLIMLILAYPLISNIDYVLHIWLGEYPPYTAIITSLVILGALLETISGPLWVSIFATGNIRSYQIVNTLILLLNLPFAYFWGKAGCVVWVIYITRVLLFSVALISRLLFLKKLIDLNLGVFFKKVLVPLASVSCILLINELLLFKYLGSSESIGSFIFQSVYLAVVTIVVIFTIGLNHKERNDLIRIIRSKLHIS